MFLLDFRLECQYSNKILVQNLNLWSNIEILVANQNFGRKFGSIPKNWWKIEILVKIGILIQYRKIGIFWSKIEILVKNRNFDSIQKNRNCRKIGIFWSKMEIVVENQNFGRKSKFFVENRNFGRKSKLWSKIEILSFFPIFRKKKIAEKK